MPTNNNLTTINDNLPQDTLGNSIKDFNPSLANFLVHLNLPVENVLSPIDEREKVLSSLENILKMLSLDKRETAYYLTKFTVAITVGLFDGALNFLWNETIKSLRVLVNDYDLQYFYSIAKESFSPKYKTLSSFDDLAAISDFDLLEISRRIGIINDVNYKRLENVNYLRNHASAAHPNENDVSGYEIVALLETCIRHVIVGEIDRPVIKVKQLLTQIRLNKIPQSDIGAIIIDFQKLPQVRVNDFVKALFGLYCDSDQSQETKNNIESLVGGLWINCSEDTKYQIGSKFGMYLKNGQVEKKESVQRFLEIVNGLSYKDEESLSSELIEKLQNLRTAHFGWNNFYNEHPHAISISESLPKNGVPKSVKTLFVKTICQCWIGNGLGNKKGVDSQAEPIYKEFIKKFTEDDVKEFVKLLPDQEFNIDFNKDKAEKRLRSLAQYLKGKTSDIQINRILDLVINFPNTNFNKIHQDNTYKEAIKYI